MRKREIEVIAERDKEIDNLKEGLRVAQLVIDKMKIEWGRLETPDSSHHAHLNSIREDIAIKKTLNEKEEMIQILSDDRKDLEDKLKIQNIALKKAEQKLKFTASQLDMLKKKHPSPNSNLKSPEVYVKQLDLASSRMAEVTAEVLEKRREVVKVKQENTVMQMKIADLERKITILEKKDA